MTTAIDQNPCTAQQLFTAWQARHCQPALEAFQPDFASPVCVLDIGECAGERVYAYGALARDHSARWWEVWTLNREIAVRHAIPDLSRHANAEEAELVTRLDALLTVHAPRCPLCMGVYDRGMETLVSFLVSGRTALTCACKEKGGDVSELLQELRSLLPWVSSTEPAGLVEIARIDVSTAPVARMLFDPSSERIMLSVDFKALKTADGKVNASFTWVRLRTQASNAQADQYEDEVDRGESFKLYLRRNTGLGQWEYFQRTDEEDVRYVVHLKHEQGMTEGWWYCRPVNPIVNSGESRQVIGVIPLAPVPLRYTPASPRKKPSDPPPSAR
ncbi:hypothetical protein KBD61_04235 [Patescibacteria group bacterium]|nr:hypothetical protein [Patescibacteria group bacterium]MBP9710203.1 hypothetical protein [Patescibacteria group bacterium]